MGVEGAVDDGVRRGVAGGLGIEWRADGGGVDDMPVLNT